MTFGGNDYGSTELFWCARSGHEKCVWQGVKRSDTAWYREDLQRSRARFLVAEAAAMNNLVLLYATITVSYPPPHCPPPPPVQ